MHNPQYVLHKTLRFDSNSSFIQGVPNNNYNEYLNFKINDCNFIELYCNEGVYTGQYNNQNIRIDMNGWILKKKYIYELYQTFFIINYLKENKMSLKHISNKIINKSI
nr:hypothetical protein [Acholeplasmatales bacterium]